MNDTDKTKEQLINELAELRRQNATLVKMTPSEEFAQFANVPGTSQALLDTIIDTAPT